MDVFYICYGVFSTEYARSLSDKCIENELELKNIYRCGESVYLRYFSSLVKLRQTQESSVLDKQIC